MPKKKFKDTTVGKLLFGAASVINPTLGNVLQGVMSPQEAQEKAAQAAAEEAKPLSDIRAPANYRKEMVKVLTAKALRQVTAST